MTLTLRPAASARIDGSSLPGRPVAGGDARPDLLHDLEIHGARVGLGDVYAAVHTVYTVYTQFAAKGRGKGLFAKKRAA